MPNLYTVPAHEPIARYSARHILATLESTALANAVLLLPNRRAAVVMRQAFARELEGKASLLPRMIPLADIENELVSLMGDSAFDALAAIPQAMSESEQRYILTQQVAAYERKRMGAVTIHYALTLADALMQLQEQCIRAGVEITQEKLRQLFYADYAEHWREALLFLGILTDTWPEIEKAYGLTTAANRETRMMEALARHWQASPPDYPVIAIGSTASQPATATLLKTVADMPLGQVILPGLDVAMPEAEWQRIEAGHPLFHLKQFLAKWPVALSEVSTLAQAKPSIWLEALAGAAAIVDWPTRALPHHESLRIIPCAHAEEEARVICLLLREGLENPAAHNALITPDEGLLARIATHMQRYGIMVDRLNAGTLANTETGSAWLALVAAIREPERQLPLRELLHHPLLAVDEALLRGLEKGWYGLNRTRAGQLPRHDASLAAHPNYAPLVALVQQLAQLNRANMRVSEWLSTLEALVAPWQKQSGKAMDAVNEQLEAMRHADALGPMGIDDLSAVLAERLSSKWRDAGIDTHPRVHLLTPVEARLQHFDRVILANMQEQYWPGSPAINPWLNRAAEKALGLAAPEERISLMAHDVLMLASSGEVFLTYPKRDGGSPTTRSRFIERLVTLYAMHGIDESAITASHYTHWAQALYASDTYAPEMPITPLPRKDERPTRLSVTSMDRLFSDPFSIYAKYVLGLRALDALDADPEASDFGSLTHRALEQLTQHWNDTHTAATESQLAAIAQAALRAISERPNIDVFWRARLMGGLRYVNGLEAARRDAGRVVISEHAVESTITLGGEGETAQTISLHGRIDRLEAGADGATIIDYKTGDMPSKSKILEGKALQLLVYAMLLENEEQAVAGVEYWQLPKLGELGETLSIEADEMPSDVPQKLRAALSQMLDPETPFLARPLASSNDDRFGNDYDGISRYDEWAG